MKEVMKRAALVIWWLGAIVLAVAVLGAIGATLSDGGGGGGVFFGYLPLALALWGVAFVLGGSFWRPPSLPPQ